MKKTLVVTILLSALTTTSFASDVGFDLNINIGNRPRGVAMVPPPVVIEEPPHFIYPGPLGLYVAIGVPYDLFYINAGYYLFNDGRWYSGRHYNGPWRIVQSKSLPSGLRRHKIHKIREIRDHEYHAFTAAGDHYRGRQFSPYGEEKRSIQRHSSPPAPQGKGHGGHGGHGRH